jgi:hypothetical protein
MDAGDLCVVKHHLGLLGIPTYRQRSAIQLDPLPWLSSLHNDQVMAHRVRGASHWEKRAGGKDCSFEFVVFWGHGALDSEE